MYSRSNTYALVVAEIFDSLIIQHLLLLQYWKYERFYNVVRNTTDFWLSTSNFPPTPPSWPPLSGRLIRILKKKSVHYSTTSHQYLDLFHQLGDTTIVWLHRTLVPLFLTFVQRAPTYCTYLYLTNIVPHRCFQGKKLGYYAYLAARYIITFKWNFFGFIFFFPYKSLYTVFTIDDIKMDFWRWDFFFSKLHLPTSRVIRLFAYPP